LHSEGAHRALDDTRTDSGEGYIECARRAQCLSLCAYVCARRELDGVRMRGDDANARGIAIDAGLDANQFVFTGVKDLVLHLSKNVAPVVHRKTTRVDRSVLTQHARDADAAQRRVDRDRSGVPVALPFASTRELGPRKLEIMGEAREKAL